MNEWIRTFWVWSSWLTLCGLSPGFFRCIFAGTSHKLYDIPSALVFLWWLGSNFQYGSHHPSRMSSLVTIQKGSRPAPSPCCDLHVVLATLIYHLPSLGRQSGFQECLVFHPFNLFSILINISTPQFKGHG